MKYILFTTSTCPKCPAMKEYIAKKMTIPGETIDETKEEFHNQAKELGIMNVPTIVIFDNTNKEVFRSNDESEIESFLNKTQ